MYLIKSLVRRVFVGVIGFFCGEVLAIPVGWWGHIVAPQLRTTLSNVPIGNYCNDATFARRTTVGDVYGFFPESLLFGAFTINDALTRVFPAAVNQAIAGVDADAVLFAIRIYGYNAQFIPNLLAPFGANADAFNAVFHHVVEQFRGGSLLLNPGRQVFHFNVPIQAGVFDSSGLTAFAGGLGFNRLASLAVNAHGALSPDNGRVKIEPDRHVAYGWLVGVYDPARDNNPPHYGLPFLWRERLKKRAIVQYTVLFYDPPDISAIPNDAAARMALPAWPPDVHARPFIQNFVEDAWRRNNLNVQYVPDHGAYVDAIRGLGGLDALPVADRAALNVVADTVDVLLQVTPRYDVNPVIIVRNDIGLADIEIDTWPYEGRISLDNFLNETPLPTSITACIAPRLTDHGEIFDTTYFVTDAFKHRDIFLYRNYPQMIRQNVLDMLHNPRSEFVVFRIQHVDAGVEIVRDDEQTRQVNALIRPVNVAIAIHIRLIDGSNVSASIASNAATITGFNVAAQPLTQGITDRISLNALAARAIGGQPQGLVCLVSGSTRALVCYEQRWINDYACVAANFTQPPVIAFFEHYQARQGMQQFNVNEWGVLAPVDDGMFNARIAKMFKQWQASRILPPPVVVHTAAPSAPVHAPAKSSAVPVHRRKAVAKKAPTLTDLDKRISAQLARIKKDTISLQAIRKSLKKLQAQEVVARRVYAQAQKKRARRAILAKNKQALDQIIVQKKKLLGQQAALQKRIKKMRMELAGVQKQWRVLAKKHSAALRKKQAVIEKQLKNKRLKAKTRKQLDQQLKQIKRAIKKYS